MKTKQITAPLKITHYEAIVLFIYVLSTIINKNIHKDATRKSHKVSKYSRENSGGYKN